MFFDRCSSKTSCFREIGVQLPCLCANLIIWSWKFKKVFFLLKCCFGFCVVLVLKLHPDPSYYLTSTMDKTHHGSIIALFYVQVLQLFSYIGVVLITNLFHCYWWIIYFGYSVNCNAKRAFMIIFLIWKRSSELSQMCWHHGHNSNKWFKQPKNLFHKAITHNR